MSQEKLQEREFFRNVGFKASDIYYVNEDAKRQATLKLKGGAKDAAGELKKKHAESLNDR